MKSIQPAVEHLAIVFHIPHGLHLISILVVHLLVPQMIQINVEVFSELMYLQCTLPLLGIVIYLHIEGALYAQKSVPSWFLAVFDSKIDVC